LYYRLTVGLSELVRKKVSKITVCYDGYAGYSVVDVM